MGPSGDAPAQPDPVEVYRPVPSLRTFVAGRFKRSLVLAWPWPADLPASSALIGLQGELRAASTATVLVLPAAPEADRRLAVFPFAEEDLPAGRAWPLSRGALPDVETLLTTATDWSSVLAAIYPPLAAAENGDAVAARAAATAPVTGESTATLDWLCKLLGID
jgi:hypothetical protein